MLQALADDETDPTALATLAAPRLRATPEQLCDAFQACPTLHPVHRRLLKLTREELRLIEDHLGQLDQHMADLLAAHQDAVQRLAEVPSLEVDSAQQIIAKVGATAATFPSPKHLASWMGACPGNQESAGVNYSHLCPKRQSPDASRPQPSRKRRGEGPRHHLRRRVSPTRPPAWSRTGHRRHHAPALSIDLEDPTRARALRRAGARPSVPRRRRCGRARCSANSATSATVWN
jgi:hypothetical protein